jgi:hypothetical protein
VSINLTILKVTTLRKEMSPALNRWTSLWYIKTGLLPVGRPSTNGFSGVGLKAWMRSCILVLAACVRELDVASMHQ